MRYSTTIRILLFSALSLMGRNLAAEGTTYLLMQPDASSPAPILEAGTGRVPNQYIVAFRDDIGPGLLPEVAADAARSVGANVSEIWSHAGKVAFFKMTADQAARLAQHGVVKYIEENARWYLSGTQQTNVDPRVCDPTVAACSPVIDDRLWHLDRADQNSPLPTGTYSYCTDGAGITVYVVDTGVNKFHNEFGPTGARVTSGYDASLDGMPADDPCLGFAVPPTGPYEYLERPLYISQLTASSHGTGVASVLGGQRVGVAKGTTIVPVKVARCDQYASRSRVSTKEYRVNQTIFRSKGLWGSAVIYRAITSGFPAAEEPASWPETPGATVQDGQVLWQVVDQRDWYNVQTTAMVMRGLNWILSPENPGPKSGAIVSMSTFGVPGNPNFAGWTGNTQSVESAVKDLLASGITIVASANNQNGNACDTSPARMSVDTAVITVGGSMLVNRPWAVDISDVPDGIEADGFISTDVRWGTEPRYDGRVAVRDARWICREGDASVACSNTSLSSTIDPTNANYPGYQGGSNGGPCVTLFTPAKNIFVASLAAPDSYRDARLRGADASGTSWSAPIAAGFAARVMQLNPGYSPSQVREALLANTAACLEDTATNPLNPRDASGHVISGTPNKLLQLADIAITASPESRAAAEGDSTPLAVIATGISPLTYQWFEINGDFDSSAYRRGAYSSTAIQDATSPTYNAPASDHTKGYWVRVANGCGSADSDIAVVVARPDPPANVSASTAGNLIAVVWDHVSDANRYLVERKSGSEPWQVAATVTGSTNSYYEPAAADGHMLAYRVRTATGESYLPPDQLAVSMPSKFDYTNPNIGTYESIASGSTVVKAQHVLELRAALNALCELVNLPPTFSVSDLALSSLQGQIIRASDMVGLLEQINAVRTHAFVGLPPVLFTVAPAVGSPITPLEVRTLRQALD